MRGLKAWWARRVSRADDPAWRLYRAIAADAVRPERLRRFGLDDTPEARFELLALHLAAAWSRMNAGGPEVRTLRQGVGEAFVADMDASLRDLGAGDLGVGRRVKALAERLYGRLAAYGPVLEATAGDAAIRAVLDRNLYKDGGAPAADAACAVRRLAAAWRDLSDDEIGAGKAPDIP